VNVCLIGAGGGIGRQLLETFTEAHGVSAVYRTLPERSSEGRNSIRFDDERALAKALADAEIVVHAALDTKSKGKAFIPANRSMTERLLDLITTEKTRLFVYFSSQVVYAALNPSTHKIQDEDAILKERPGLDAYTRLKLIEEQRVIEVCRQKGIDYLIVRPTVVMGPHMQWSSGIVDAMRVAPFGIKDRTINLIHVADLARQLLALVERGVRNEIVNLGDFDVASDDYFRHAASLARRPMLFAPAWLAKLAGRAIPSTLWFLAHDVRVTSDKVRRLSGLETNRKLEDFFEPPARTVHVHDLETIRATMRSGRPYRTFGQGYFLWFNDHHGADRLIMQSYAGVVGLEGDRLTVRAGTTLAQILVYLSPHGLTLETMPEFVDISAGACFFTEVHGSSGELISVYELIAAIRYLKPSGEEVFSERDDATWDALRGDNTIVITEVVFRCGPSRLLSNVIEWEPDDRLEAYVGGGYLENLSTTVHWYPRNHELMVYRVNPLEQDLPRDRRPFAPLRGAPFLLQKLILRLRLRGKTRIVGPAEQVLAPWTMMPAKHILGRIFMGARLRIRNMELCIPDSHAPEFIRQLRQKMPEMALFPGQGVGIRFTRQPSTGRGFVWIEMTSRNAAQMHGLIDIAQAVCGDAFWLHRGKYVPGWVDTTHLFIPRSIAAAPDAIDQK
jgi:nucleoside-diphosphate-sugar epimerase